MTCTVLRLKTANFSGQGLPNITPFVQASNLVYGYDFRNGSLINIKTGIALEPFRMNGSKVADPTVVTVSPDKLSITLDQYGLLVTQNNVRNYALGGADTFTMMVIGGDGGGTSAAVAQLMNIGNVGDAASSLPVIDATYSASNVARIGMRAKSTAVNVFDGSVLGNLYAMFVVYDGTNLILYNKTLGTSYTNSLTSLGITDMIGNGAGGITKHLIGKSSTTLNTFRRACKLAQMGYWETALSPAQITEQYAMSKLLFGDLI